MRKRVKFYEQLISRFIHIKRKLIYYWVRESDWAAAIAAYEWIQQINSRYAASEDFSINQVIYNEDMILLSEG